MMGETVPVPLPLSPGRLMTRFLITQRSRIAAAICAGVLTILSSVCLMAISAYLIERASQRPPILSLEIAIVSVRFFGISRGLFRYLDRLLSHDASFRLLGDIRADVYRTLIPLAPGGLRDSARGELLSRIAVDVDTMQEWFVRGFCPLCTSLLAAILVVLAATIILPGAGFALCVVLFAAAVVMVAVTRSGGAAARREAELQGMVTSDIVDYVQGIADLTAMGAAPGLAASIEANDRERTRLWSRRVNRSAMAAAVQASLPGLVAVLLAGLGIAAVPGGLNPLQVGVLCLGGMAAVECVSAIPGAVAAWERGQAAAGRLAELAALPSPTPGTELERLERPARRLSLNGVSFRYDNSTPSVLDDVSLHVSRGQSIVIHGHSGAGKTTLANLLLRFMRPQAGTILLDGRDLSSLSDHEVRQSICAATQDAHLFAGSIRQNILLARPQSTEEDLRTVLHSTRLADWVDGLPNGLETDVGDLGSEVSGGQRRRIALARVLLARCPFIIADEPTEGLDTPTARAVMETLFSASRGRGLIVITHRLDLCPRADRVYHLAGGRLTPVQLDGPAEPVRRGA